MKGRKPKPREVRIREGMAGHTPLPEKVVVAGPMTREQLRTPPEYLPEDGKQLWCDVSEWLIDLGIVDQVDRPALEQIATQYARIRQAQRVIASEGHYARGSTGQLVEHPALKIERDATALFLKLAEHYALTPVARVRLGIAELERRSLQRELEAEIGPPQLRQVG